MKTCTYDGDTGALGRSHPYTHGTNAAFRYLDLRASPGLIRTSLEDFRDWSRYAAVDTFYALLEWINGASSVLESNDCSFSAPEREAAAAGELGVACSGRTMVLFRHLPRNLSTQDWSAFTHAFHETLARTDPLFELGMIGTTLVPVHFRRLPEHARDGQQLMVSFWAWGKDERRCMANLARLMNNLASALRDVAGQEAPV